MFNSSRGKPPGVNLQGKYNPEYEAGNPPESCASKRTETRTANLRQSNAESKMLNHHSVERSNETDAHSIRQSTAATGSVSSASYAQGASRIIAQKPGCPVTALRPRCGKHCGKHCREVRHGPGTAALGATLLNVAELQYCRDRTTGQTAPGLGGTMTTRKKTPTPQARAARAWDRWKEPWAWTATALGWFITAHFGYLAYVAFTAGSAGRAIAYAAATIIFAVVGPMALHHRPGRYLASRDNGTREDQGMIESPPGPPGIPQSPQPQDETDLHKLAPRGCRQSESVMIS